MRLCSISLAFLPPVPGEAVTIRSTDVDRCLQSVHSLLDELYPQSMIPVHTMPESQEKLLQVRTAKEGTRTRLGGKGVEWTPGAVPVCPALTAGVIIHFFFFLRFISRPAYG